MTQESGARSPRTEATLRANRARAVTLSRALLPTWAGTMAAFCEEVRRESGIGIPAFRTLFPADADLFLAIEQELVEECADRVRSVAESFRPAGDSLDADVAALAVALAEARPLDWSSLTIRLRERQLAAASGSRREEVVQSERAFVPSLTAAFEALLASIGRRFEWRPMLAVRVILLTYERSFESWVVSGQSESSFATSAYIQQTLPELLLGVSRPV